MHDVFPHQASPSRGLADFKVHWLLLFPDAWARCKLPLKLSWELLPFSAAHLPRVPDDKRGVYSFVVQPGIADHPACSYLLYVGQTGRNFRARYREYLREQAQGENSRRPHVSGMLNKWKDHLWFCFAHIEDATVIVPTEDALLEAYLPPTNVELPGRLRNRIAWHFGT